MPKCTYCGGTTWFGGPSGGMSQNILCANPECRHWFNYAEGMMFDDLHRVEPTKEEEEATQRRYHTSLAEHERTLYQEGADLFESGGFAINLRKPGRYGAAVGPQANEDNIIRLCGFIDAMAEKLHSPVQLSQEMLTSTSTQVTEGIKPAIRGAIIGFVRQLDKVPSEYREAAIQALAEIRLPLAQDQGAANDSSR